MISKSLALLATLLFAHICAAEEQWRPLFNGKDLSGWTPKFAKSPLGENYKNTYRVEDGVLKADYENWDRFDMRFGHLYSNVSYSHYVLKLEYKILPFENLPDAPPWTALNSGVMVHSQSPLSLRLEQGFPVSIEGQFLAQGTTAGTKNGNVVTPGTHITYQGELTKDHIVNADAPLPAVGEWVSFEAEVRGHDEIIYRIGGREILRFHKPILDNSDADAQRLLESGASREVDSGHIALQAEGHPIWFRNIMIRPLDGR